MIPVTCFAGKRVAVFGLGRSGLATVEALLAGGASVCAWDDNESARASLEGSAAEVCDLRDVDFATLDALVLAPGVPLTHPEPHWTVLKAHDAGIEIIGDTELFVRELAHGNRGAKLVAITGTNGKSTTTALIGHVLRCGGRQVCIGGNIGTAVLSLEPPEAGMIYVVEFSSYQIDLTPGLRPDVAILLNITPDHLDRHGDFDHYASVKARIFDQQVSGDTAVIAVDDATCRNIAAALVTEAHKVEVSSGHELAGGFFSAAGRVHKADGGVTSLFADLAGIVSLRGDHNGQNAAAAAAAAVALGLSQDEIVSGFASFPGLSHRMEQVGELDGVLFINDSKATNADAAARALSSFEHIFWIAGGLAKDGGIQNLKEFFPKIEKAYLIGDAAGQFAGELNGAVEHETVGTLERAVTAVASDMAVNAVRPATVLFSPACASFDQFRNFELRGDAFRDAVHALSGMNKSKGN